MSLIFAMKMLSDICFYFTFANFFAVLLGGNNVLTSLPLFIISSLLCAILKSRKIINFLPICIMFYCFFIFPMTFINIMLLVPPIFYVGYNVIKIHSFKENFKYDDTFSIFIKSALIFLLFFMIFNYKTVEQASFPYAFIFFVNSVILMRFMRHRLVSSQIKSKLINIVPVLLVIFTVFILSSKFFFEIFKWIIGSMYLKIILPILTFILSCVVYILSPLFHLPKLTPEQLAILFKFGGSGMLNLNLGFNDSELRNFLILKFVVNLLLVLLVLFIIVKFFKKLLKNRGSRKFETGVIERRTSIDNNRKPSHKFQNRKYNKVREIYKKFLLMCKSADITIKPYMTSEDIERSSVDEFKKPEILREIRSMYINVRYGEKIANNEYVKSMKALYDKLKKV